MNTRLEAILVVVAVGALVSGCVRPVREQLVSLSSAADLSETSRDAPTATISLGRVTMPEYLDGYDIVSRVSPHELKRDQHSRWAERLPEASARVLRAALAEQGLRVADGGTSVVAVNIAAFEASANGVVSLSATWLVSDLHHDPIGRGADVIEQPSGAGAAAQAAAMESALQRLAADIAVTIKGVADAAGSSARQ